MQSDCGYGADKWHLANTWDVDRANEKIRSLSQDLEQERANRQGTDYRLEQLTMRLDELEQRLSDMTVVPEPSQASVEKPKAQGVGT